jgi:hypothetical protein
LIEVCAPQGSLVEFGPALALVRGFRGWGCVALAQNSISLGFCNTGYNLIAVV